MEKINFEEKIQKIRSLIKLWNRRYLTPLGKITVIKTLPLPILNHLFISIPNPSEHIIKELNFFLLRDGPAKIKLCCCETVLRRWTKNDKPESFYK